MTILHKTYHALIGVAIGLLGLWLFAGCIVPQEARAQATIYDAGGSIEAGVEFTVTVNEEWKGSYRFKATEQGYWKSFYFNKGIHNVTVDISSSVQYDILDTRDHRTEGTFILVAAYSPNSDTLATGYREYTSARGYICPQGRSGAKCSDVSSPIVQGTPQPLPGIDPPQYLRAAPGDGEATLTWDAPFYDPGDITGYAYRYKEGTTYTDIPESGPGEENARSYTVTGLTNGTEYKFEVRAENGNRDGTPASVKATPEISVSSESDELPTSMQLYQNYPNPFNPATTITYRLDQASTVKVILYDLRGQEIANIFSGHRLAGEHSVHFEPHGLPSGTYVYRLVTDAGSLVRTMTLIK